MTDASPELQIHGAQCGETGRWQLCLRAGDLATARAEYDEDTPVLNLSWCWGGVPRKGCLDTYMLWYLMQQFSQWAPLFQASRCNTSVPESGWLLVSFITNLESPFTPVVLGFLSGLGSLFKIVFPCWGHLCLVDTFDAWSLMVNRLSFRMLLRPSINQWIKIELWEMGVALPLLTRSRQAWL